MILCSSIHDSRYLEASVRDKELPSSTNISLVNDSLFLVTVISWEYVTDS